MVWDETSGWIAEDSSAETVIPSNAAVSLEEINHVGKGDAVIDEKVLARKLGAGTDLEIDGEEREKSKSIAGSEALAIYLEWVPGDESNPVNWPTGRKWRTTLICSAFTTLVAAVGSSYAVGQESMMQQLGSSKFLTILGLSTYPLGMVLRNELRACTDGVYRRLRSDATDPRKLLGDHWSSEDVHGVDSPVYDILRPARSLRQHRWSLRYSILARLCWIVRIDVGRWYHRGSFRALPRPFPPSTRADFMPQDAKDRGLPMSLFSMFAFIGTGVGPAFGGYVAEALDWRWIQWIQGMLAIVMAIALIFFTEETRGSIILSRKAAKLRKSTGDERYQCRSDSERTSYATMIRISVTRPLCESPRCTLGLFNC